MANGWYINGLDYFDNKVNRPELHDSYIYIYEYVINYLNVVFKDKLKDKYEVIIKRKLSDYNDKQYEYRFLGFIKNWNDQLGPNMDESLIDNKL
ncbi:hypothetical protein [Mycoplasma sp. Mirounga ES2805-ORL]|uniref:hypothetical protein n=1 Tax=Mycoplasma sp. Mirounga ES2805-ORL TaxID=754514 RepID=UPI00197BF6D1|nr:hypothetical protein [Mycoplasma sp. Mirounga ES2805-ORL]QSF13852.1 hypothetical protein JXZ90_00935 [Mycoplasma sp. Mirounga ES2805-ORL]